MFRVILYRDPDTDPFWNEGAPTALEFTAPAARGDGEGNLILPQAGGVEILIKFPTCGDVYFSGWNMTRFEIEEIK